MKTPDKNKCGLECIRTNVERVCVKPEKGQCPRCEQLVGESLDRIQQLEAELAEVEKERDAAIRDIPRVCGYCKWYEITNNRCTPDHDCKNPNGCLNISGINTGWQWRGVCAENTEVQEGDH